MSEHPTLEVPQRLWQVIWEKEIHGIVTHGDFHLQCAGNELLNLVQLTFSQVDGYQQQQLTVGAVALTCPGGRRRGGEEGGGRGRWVSNSPITGCML